MIDSRKTVLSILILFCINHTCYAQTHSFYTDSTANYFDITGFGNSGPRTPFWIQSNQFGTIPATGPALSIRSAAEYYWKLAKKDQHKNVWRFGAGAEVIGNISENTKLLFPQLHATLRFRNWELYAGRKNQWVGLADSTLGTGSYAWSTNALPIPKIHIGTTRFIAVPLTREWLSFQATYSDGWFEKGRPVTSGLKLHQKSFYLRIGKAGSILKLYGGFNHQVQWGGRSPYNTVNGKMPAGFKNYVNTVTGKAHSENDGVFDNTGRVGNHLGSIDLAIEVETYAASIFLYRQNIYEDGSLFWLSNIRDGLNGIRLQRKNSYGANFEITMVVLEYLHTKSQGGSIADWDKPSYARGKDDYFNNGQVRDGWSYFDRTIGTPFIPPTSDTNWKWPNYSDFFTSNNRVSVFHVGLKGTFLQHYFWSSKLSFSGNSGTYDVPFEGSPTESSGVFTIRAKGNIMAGLQPGISVGADFGSLYPNTTGVSLVSAKILDSNN